MDQRLEHPLRIIRTCNSVCELVCQRCWKYASRSDAPPEELDQLIRHLVELFGGLHCLHLTLVDPTNISHVIGSGMAALLYECDLTFERLLDAFDRDDATFLEEGDPSRRLWPFPKRKTLRWISEVSQHKEKLSSLVNQSFTSRILSGTSTVTSGNDVQVSFNAILNHLGERWKAWKNNKMSKFLLQRLHDMADLLALAVSQTDSEEITTARYEGMQVLSLAIVIENDRFIDVCLDKYVTVDVRDDSKPAYTPLELAAEHGLPRRIVKKMLTKSKEPHAKNAKGWSPIHTACERGYLHVVEELLDAGVDVNLDGYEGMNPLLMSASNQQPSIVKLLLSRGANVHAVNKHSWNSCHFAANHGDVDVMELLKETEIDWNWDASAALDRVWHSKMRPIHFATCAGSAAAVSYLFDNGLIDDLNCATKEGLTATHFAVIENQPEILRYLLFVGADPNRAWKSPWPTPLHLAARFGPIKLAETLLANKADVHTVSELGLTPENIADKFKHSDIQELLRRHRLHSTDETPPPKYLCDVPKGDSTLRLLRCISKGTLDACKTAIDDGADLNLSHLHTPRMRSVCCTPLLRALNSRRPNVAKLLIVRGATIQGRNCKNIMTHFGYTTMHLAARFGYTDVLRLLLERYSELESTLELCPVHPIHIAIAFNKKNAARTLLGLELSETNTLDDDQVSMVSSQSLRHPDILLGRHSSSPELSKGHAPVYPKISLDHLEKETLEYYGLPWEYHKLDSGYIVILRELNEHETDVLFEHTQKLRQRNATEETNEDDVEKGIAAVSKLDTLEIFIQARKVENTDRGSAHPLAILSIQETVDDDTFDFEPFPILRSSSPPGRASLTSSTLYCGSALHIACTAGNEELALMLTDEASVPIDILDVNLMTPLLRAADYGHITLMDQLLTRGANLEARNDVLETALLIAADTGDLDTVQHLASTHAANAFARSAIGVSSLLRAAEQDHAPMLAYLIGLGATPSLNDASTAAGHVACERDAASDSYNNVNDNGITVLARGESVLCASFFGAAATSGVTTSTYLLNARAVDLAAVNASSGSALHVACAFVHVGAVRRILRLLTASERARVLRVRAAVYGTPLYVAAASGNVDVVGMLLSVGAEVDAVGGEYGTAVMVAARYGRVGVVKVLLEYGAGVGCVCDGGVLQNLWDAAAGERSGKRTGRRVKDNDREANLVLNGLRRWLLVGRFLEAPRLLQAT